MLNPQASRGPGVEKDRVANTWLLATFLAWATR
jgi:hypothetical protein